MFKTTQEVIIYTFLIFGVSFGMGGFTGAVLQDNTWKQRLINEGYGEMVPDPTPTNFQLKPITPNQNENVSNTK